MFAKVRRRWLELAFFSAGLVAAATFIVLSMPALMARLTAPAIQSAIPQASDADGAIIPATLGASYASASAVASGTRIATLRIPALHLEQPVVEGVSDSELRRGVGHVPGSAQSGGLGNDVLAGHRDTVLRPLRQVQKGMEIQLASSDGIYHYLVDSMQIVAPNQLEVMDIAAEPQVTLVTCYPFNFIGGAPKRFVVKAHLVSATPSSN